MSFNSYFVSEPAPVLNKFPSWAFERSLNSPRTSGTGKFRIVQIVRYILYVDVVNKYCK